MIEDTLFGEEKRLLTHMQRLHFSSATGRWTTPKALFDDLNTEFGFTLDACADSKNAKCKRFYSEEDDSLLQPWQGIVFVNPPYGGEIVRWIQKGYLSAMEGATVVMLVPSRTDTRWFHDYCMKGEIRFLRGRLRFGETKNAAPFPSCVVIFRGKAA